MTIIERDNRDQRGDGRIRFRRCERCGYDLRGLASARCPECGTKFDPMRVLVEPRIPWLMVDGRGAFERYLATVRLVLARPSCVADDFWTGSTIDARACGAFRHVSVTIAAISLGLALMLLMSTDMVIGAVAGGSFALSGLFGLGAAAVLLGDAEGHPTHPGQHDRYVPLLSFATAALAAMPIVVVLALGARLGGLIWGWQGYWFGFYATLLGAGAIIATWLVSSVCILCHCRRGTVIDGLIITIGVLLTWIVGLLVWIIMGVIIALLVILVLFTLANG